MEWMHLLQAVFSLIFVIGLLFLTVWLFKYCEQKGLNSSFFKGLKSNSAINIIEHKRITAKTSLCLFECDGQRYLILCGNSQDHMLDKHPTTQGTAHND